MKLGIVESSLENKLHQRARTNLDGKVVKENEDSPTKVECPRFHVPVMVREIIDFLRCLPGKIYLDCTLGTGGHAEAILRKITPQGKLIGIDCDKQAVRIAKERLKSFENAFIAVNDNFLNIGEILSRLNIVSVDGILLDLGFSSHQLDNPERGFSFLNNGPLDMRMDTSTGTTAGELLNGLREEEISDILRKYGEERRARTISRLIVGARKRKMLNTTAELAKTVSRAYKKRGRLHPATRTFQALRIAVNNELENLEVALKRAVGLLSCGGRICAISYHSLEDRIVKTVFSSLSKDPEGAKLELITRKPVVPERGEVSLNRRARSAKLRAAERL